VQHYKKHVQHYTKRATLHETCHTGRL